MNQLINLNDYFFDIFLKFAFVGRLGCAPYRPDLLLMSFPLLLFFYTFFDNEISNFILCPEIETLI